MIKFANEMNHTELRGSAIPVDSVTGSRPINDAYLHPGVIQKPSTHQQVAPRLSTLPVPKLNDEQCTASNLSHAGAASTNDARPTLSPSSSCSSNSTLVNSRSFCFQDFKVLGSIGGGAQGTVYCVRDSLTRECMALKVVSKDRKREWQIRSLLAEQNTLSLLNEDPWFVSLQASWSDSQNFYLAMEMHPSNLQDVVLEEGKLQPARAQFYMAEIIVALRFLHSCGIVHRDVKPANILLSRKGHILLADFGFVKDFHQVPSLDERTFQPYWPYLRTDVPTMPYRAPWQLKFVARGHCGTPVHMAPEIIIGHPYAFGVDFWAAAVTLFQMLTGRPPWLADDRWGTKNKILNDKLEIKEGEMAHDAEDFLRKMLRKLPYKRLRSGHDMESHPYFSNINWHLIAKRVVPIPADWIPMLQPSQIAFDNVKPIVPGEPYDNCGNKDPYPEFCWTSERLRRVADVEAVNEKAARVEEEHWYGMVENVNKRLETTPHSRFFKRLLNRIKILGRSARPRGHNQITSFFALRPTPDTSSWSSCYTS